MWVPRTPSTQLSPLPGHGGEASCHIATCWDQPRGLTVTTNPATASPMSPAETAALCGCRAGTGRVSSRHWLFFINFQPTAQQPGMAHVQTHPRHAKRGCGCPRTAQIPWVPSGHREAPVPLQGCRRLHRSAIPAPAGIAKAEPRRHHQPVCPPHSPHVPLTPAQT